MGPAGVPHPVLEKLRVEIIKAVEAADVRERFATLAVEPRTNTPEQLRALLETDLKRWAKVVKEAGTRSE